MRRIPILGLLAACVFIAGCNILAYPLYLIAPSPPKETVKAEFDGLRRASVAVVIYADMDTLYEYPYTREELTARVAQELRDNIKKVEVIDPALVIRHQNANVHWGTRPVAEVGRALGADYVLYLSLSEFSTHERGSIALPVGRVSAAASVWDVHADPADPAACVWRAANVSVKVDASTGVLAYNNIALRIQMQRVFANRLVKHFYDHKVPRGSRDVRDDLGIADAIR
jgi:hypothetical protein